MVTKTNKKPGKVKPKRITPAEQIEKDLIAGGELATEHGPDLSIFKHLTNFYDTPQRHSFGGALASLAGIDPQTGALTGKLGGVFGAEIPDIINRMKQGLEGYAAPELQRDREQAARNIEGSFATNLRGLRADQARSGVRGAQAIAQQNNLMRERIQQQQNIEQDLLIKNADEKQRRLKDFGSYLNEGVGVQQGLLNDYRGFLDTQTTGYGNVEALNQGMDLAKARTEITGKAGFAGQIEAERNRRREAKFRREHPNSNQGGSGGSVSSSGGGGYNSEAIDKILSMVADYRGGGTGSGDIDYPH